MSTPRVALRDITRRFGPVLANDRVSLDVMPGVVHALVGENGAGKSTLMRVLYGLLAPEKGSIEIDGRTVAIRRPADAMRLGIGMVHQHFMLVDPLTAAENVTLGREPCGPFGALHRNEAEREVEELCARHRLPVDPRARAGALSVGAQQRLEILKALRRKARVLILDEPTAVLTPQEVDDLFAVLDTLRRDGTSIVLITHKLGEVRALADQVTVMRSGRVVGAGATADMSIERMAELMVGRPIPPLRERSPAPPGEPLLRVRGLEVQDDRRLPVVRGVTLDVCAGEIVGIAGVEGNGQHELVESIAGLRAPARGSVEIAGRSVSGRSAREHTESGLAHIPSDRLRRGLVPEMSLAENLVLGRHRTRGRWRSGSELEQQAIPLLEQYDIRPPHPSLQAGRLSGGNQQKLIAARELSRNAQVVVAAHPTRGVDVSAIEFLHHRLLAERDQGRAVLLISSELTELLALSDRILVMYEGKVVHETRPKDTDERTLGLYMAGRTPE